MTTHDYLHCKLDGCDKCNVIERQKKLRELVKSAPRPTREQKTAALQVIREKRSAS